MLKGSEAMFNCGLASTKNRKALCGFFKSLPCTASGELLGLPSLTAPAANPVG